MKLLAKIRSAEVNVGTSKKRVAWYRGQACSAWPLLPKLFRFRHTRDFLYRAENALFADFSSDGQRYLASLSVRDSWDVLAAMQHYGVSTRLLDWTTELDIALYFALCDSPKISMGQPETWPCIWVLNPYRLNRLYYGEDVVFDRADKIPFDYYEETIACIRSSASWPHEFPIAFKPGFSNDRMQAQHGRFTVHGNSLNALDTEELTHLDFWGIQRVTIDPNDFGELKRHGSRAAAYHLQMFPDIYGYTRFLNQREKV